MIAGMVLHGEHPRSLEAFPLSLPAEGNPEFCTLPRVKKRECFFQAGIRKIRKIGHRFRKVSPAGQITPGDSNHLSIADMTEDSLQPRNVLLVTG